MKSLNTISLTLLAAIALLCSSMGKVHAQQGIYLTLDAGMAFRDFKPAPPALRTSGELKWMFLPYLGVGINVTLQRPGPDPNIAPLSSAMQGITKNISSPYIASTYSITEITDAYCFNLIFQPIAIVRRNTQHLFSITVGGGIASGYTQTWDFPHAWIMGGSKSVDYNYSGASPFLGKVTLAYAYQFFGPFFLGVHAGFAAAASFEFFYIYAGATAGLRFGNLSRKAKPTE